MEQIDLLEMEQEFEQQVCLTDLPVAQDQVDPQVFTLVVETSNYRIEIEIG